MNASLFANMLRDKHFFSLERMQYKYSAADVAELMRILESTMLRELPLRDFEGKALVYLPGHARISGSGIKKLSKMPTSGEKYGQSAMEDEIFSSMQIESIHSSRQSIRRILGGSAPRDEAEDRIYGMKCGLDFIADRANGITEKNLYRLYQTAIGAYLDEENRLLPGRMYRHDEVYIVGGRIEHQGISAARLPEAMAELVAFANAEDGMEEVHKAASLHFMTAYLHPYFDGNGRMARLLHLWYLVQRGYPSALFIPFSKYIEQSRAAYYRAFDLVEKNAVIGGRVDITPFLAYFAENVYEKLEAAAEPSEDKLTIYETARKSGKITRKEAELWAFVLSAYGSEPFSTKQLEKAFGKAAYATIRGFVLKFAALGLLEAEKYGNKTLYRV